LEFLCRDTNRDYAAVGVLLLNAIVCALSDKNILYEMISNSMQLRLFLFFTIILLSYINSRGVKTLDFTNGAHGYQNSIVSWFDCFGFLYGLLRVWDANCPMPGRHKH
jgi:hypothetical protein